MRYARLMGTTEAPHLAKPRQSGEAWYLTVWPLLQ